MMKNLLLRSGAASLVLLAVASCGSRSGLPVPEPSQCVSLHTSAQIADLDVFTMMDASGSMDYPTGQGGTKWEAVRAALASFLHDADSTGIGVSITFFPVVDNAIPETCASDATCGNVSQACQRFGLCLPDGASNECDVDQDCADAGFPASTCHPIGFCEKDIDVACLPADGGAGCDEATQGACLNVGLCENHYACGAGSYASPAVPVATLPGAADVILQAIDKRTPDGSTTTLPALTGAVGSAIAWRKDHPSHKAIVLLATDGLPTVCDPALHDDDLPAAIQHIADAAADGVANGVQTFVIGVFQPEEAMDAAPALDAIAKAGGTKTAYLVSTQTDVTDPFLAALNEVRLTSKSCEFGIPLVDGALPDLGKMTVQITPAGGEPVTVVRRGSAGECGAESGGFYYDVPLGGDVDPGRIILCPASCELFGTALDRQVDLQVSCD